MNALRSVQRLDKFALPAGFRGRSAFFVQLWWFVQATFFRHSPQIAYGFRVWLLRLFGAKIGRGVLIRPSVSVTYPWKVRIGDWAWVGDGVVLYSLGEIDIGAHAVISQGVYLCSADHDYRFVDFPIRARSICICDQVWIAADCFVGPGVTIGAGAVVGARSSVFKDLPEATVCMGSPCRAVKPRESLLR